MYPPFYAHCFSLGILRLLPLFFILRSWPFSVASSVSLRRNRGMKVCSGFSRFLFSVFLQFLSVSCVLYFLPFVAPSLSPLSFFFWFCDPLSLVFSLSFSVQFPPVFPSFFFPAVWLFRVPSVSFFLLSPSRGCLYPGFYRAGRSIGAVTAGSNGVGRSIQWRNVPAFNGGAAAEEENERTVACPKTTPFSNFKGCFQFGSWNSCNFAIKPLVKM